MPTDGEKLLQRARQSRANWTYGQLIELYTSFGFKIKNTKRSGSHRVIFHPDYPRDLELMTTVSQHSGEISKGYIKDAVKLIDRLKDLREGDSI